MADAQEQVLTALAILADSDDHFPEVVAVARRVVESEWTRSLWQLKAKALERQLAEERDPRCRLQLTREHSEVLDLLRSRSSRSA